MLGNAPDQTRSSVVTSRYPGRFIQVSSTQVRSIDHLFEVFAGVCKALSFQDRYSSTQFCGRFYQAITCIALFTQASL